MRAYVAASRDDAAFAAYLEEHVFGVESHEEYVERFVRRTARPAERVT
jgi:hypothetical protein